jgi:hypothetical protein
MPCYDQRDRSSLSDELAFTNQELSDSKHENELLSAYLCAIISEVKLNVIDLDGFIQSASLNGKCPTLVDWYKKHHINDETRILKELQNHFSFHEIEMLKTILNKNG